MTEVLELTCNCRCNCGINRCVAVDCHNSLENLTFVNNCAERTAYKAHSARNALVIINICSAVFIAVDSFHTACGGTRTLLLYDCIVRTRTLTFSAFDALFIVNMRFSVYNRDCSLRANLCTRVFKTALTAVCHNHSFSAHL